MNLLRLFLAQLLTTRMILAGLLMAFHYDWPDHVHTDYGIPLVWAIHTESTITRPVDIWRVNPTNLVANVAIWTILSLALITLIGILSYPIGDGPSITHEVQIRTTAPRALAK